MSWPALALSTCWCSQRHQDGRVMLEEMARLGFRKVELSHGLRVSLAEGAVRAVQAGVVEVGSCHNFCPLPANVSRAAPNLFSPCSPQATERAQWVRQTQRSLEFCALVRSPLLVCHLGRAQFRWRNPEGRIDAAADDRPAEVLAQDVRFAQVRDAAVALVRARAQRHWPWLLDSLRQVLPVAAAKGVRLVFENRERFDELPLDDGFPELMRALAGEHAAAAGCWHDTGHAEIKRQLGGVDPDALLTSVAPWLAGFHLHDVSATRRDHQPLGTGKIDWKRLRPHLRPEHACVLELHPAASAEAVRASHRFWDELGRG